MRVVAGEIFDVAVDLRRGSPTFGDWIGVKLSAANRRMLWIPAGFAHGFYTISEWAEVVYKVTDYYTPDGNGLCVGMIPKSTRLALDDGHDPDFS